ncbi:hypothetical protein A5692_01245 [Mycobacterium sp. E342]|nr:hypothetical protein A5692_01245 [Mycobacterium sp. E342]
MPATEAIRPLTRASPAAGAGDVVVDVTVDVDVDGGLDLFDEPQAAMDNAVVAATATTATRVNRAV